MPSDDTALFAAPPSFMGVKFAHDPAGILDDMRYFAAVAGEGECALTGKQRAAVVGDYQRTGNSNASHRQRQLAGISPPHPHPAQALAVV